MRDEYDLDRLKQANDILQTFLPSSRLIIAQADTTRPYIAIETTTEYPDGIRRSIQPAIPSSSGSALSGRSGRLRFGGTAEEGIATLIRFVRGRTRRPMSWWRERFPPATYAAVWATSYRDDPSMSACVLCGKPEPGADWWGADRWTQGPCCAFGACKVGPGANGRASRGNASMGTSGGLGDALDGMFGVDGRMIYRGTVVQGGAGEVS
jgi:hypothetical protein